MFEQIDWWIVIGYLALATCIGLFSAKSSGQNLKSYFGADGKLPWWWVGTSMVATTFAADTPLVITELVTTNGIAANWLWWSWAIFYLFITIFLAAKWKKSGVLTDVEFTELRYSGKPAEFLRGFKAFFFGIVINCIILGWVFTAMTKIASPFIDWQLLIGESGYQTFAAIWPSAILFNDVNTTITVLVMVLLVGFYASLGGLKGVMLTDLFQFAIAMSMAVVFAYLAVDYVGGMPVLLETLQTSTITAGEKSVEGHHFLDFMPSIDGVLLPFSAFLLYIGSQWWARHDSDGSGYLAQRINTAKSAKDAQLGTLWFTVANICFRSWPWIIIGLVSLVVFWVDGSSEFTQLVQNEPQMGYPILMKLILPAGILGLTFVSLLAAFMSTVDTHLNWGASYLVNDLYKRFYKPNLTPKQAVMAGRIALVLLVLISIPVAAQIGSIEKAWIFVMAISSGLGIVHILRWLWWRINAWSEIAGIAGGLITMLLIQIYAAYFPETPTTNFITGDYSIVICGGLSLIAILIATHLTAPESDTHLQQFYQKVQPFGFWKDMGTGNIQQRFGFPMLQFGISMLGVYALLFGIGKCVLLEYSKGVILIAVGCISLTWIVKTILKPSTNG